MAKIIDDSDMAVNSVPVMLPLALDEPYHYLAGELHLSPGDFVSVELRSREQTGVVWDAGANFPEINPNKLKPVLMRHDLPPLPEVSRRFCEWVANYTVTPAGTILRMMMSARGVFAPQSQKFGIRLGDIPASKLTPARQKVLATITADRIWVKSELAAKAGVGVGVINSLLEEGVLLRDILPPTVMPIPDQQYARPELSDEQRAGAETLHNSVKSGEFNVFLLDGITGSGKTEVYFEAVAAALAEGRQSLIMLPEIALTSQFITRFAERFGVLPASWHSAMRPTERVRIWRAVASGEAKVVIGARSALFLPYPDLGAIIVDEEHESAFKQEEGGNYHARDMAVVRGMLGRATVVLSSATPSLESYANMQGGRYRHIKLRQRYSGAILPELAAIDMRSDPPEKGKWLSPVLIDAVAKTLKAGNQALLFLNRRGYAPLTLCRKCGHRFECPNCSAWLVEHRFTQRLQCHQCGHEIASVRSCPECGEDDSLVACGPGVERVAEEVRELFPDASSVILSSDLLSSLEEMRQRLAAIAAGKVDIIVGTQLVAKGHHFPKLALVGVVDGDLGLAQTDPRASERTYQLLHQVTGRAGREKISGRGLIQTYMPEHPVMQAIIASDREQFFAREIDGRKLANLPPFGKLAGIIISAANSEAASSYARALAMAAPRSQKISLLGPAEAPVAIIRKRHRYRILLKARREADLQAYIRTWLQNAPPPRGSVRLGVDIDPYSFM
jgi:primosomal protein N' (replication factor Y)